MSVKIGNYIVTCNGESTRIAFNTFAEAQDWVNAELRKKECCNAPQILIAKIEGIAQPYRTIQWKWQESKGVYDGTREILVDQESKEGR